MLSACRSRGAMLSRLSLLPRAGQVRRTAFTARTLVTVNTKSAGPQVLGGRQKKVPTFTFGRLALISRAMCSDSSSSQSPQQPQLDNTASQPTPAPSNAGDHEGQLNALQPQPNMRVMHNNRLKYRRPYTPADMFNAAQNDTPIRFMVNPPEENDSALLRDVYLDTSTLEWLYHPPIPSIGAHSPEHKNLSTVLVLYHPQSIPPTMDQGGGYPFAGSTQQPFTADYYMYTSYVMPTAQLSVGNSPGAEGYYSVSFKVTENPSAIYYDYNSYYKRYALYEMRNGHRIYLKPVYLPTGDPRSNKVIKGVAVEDEQNIPVELFAFQAFEADVHLYITSLPAQ